ncbi:MAG TPA: Gfo/Idh/MocA family oxidoreductase [Verrucomicrobiales bacterium]|nr:Gfo/Idh/MocA family oxidoreductase [Verrucomicrobiales bacterium]
MRTLRFAVLGAGFWSQFQLAAWRELRGARCVALYNRSRNKAEDLAQRFGIPSVYDDPETLLSSERLDFVDIITSADTHAYFTTLAARRGLPVICQKPMAPTLAAARSMAAVCRKAEVLLLIHENWRWQTPIRAVKRVLDSDRLGSLIRARIDYAHSFPVFDNQPSLRDLDQFILTDIGTHILDVARFLFGEASELYCQTRRIHPNIRGEDVATVMLRMKDSVTVACNMSYASRWDLDRFPETFIAVEGARGGLSLGPDYTLRVVSEHETVERRVPPPSWPWADPAYAVVHASIVDCCRNLLRALQCRASAETTAEDNLKTLQLVFQSYHSAASGRAMRISS